MNLTVTGHSVYNTRGLAAIPAVVLLIATTFFAAYGQEKPAERQKTPCEEKRDGLANFEAEAPRIRSAIEGKEKFLRELTGDSAGATRVKLEYIEDKIAQYTKLTELRKKVLAEQQTGSDAADMSRGFLTDYRRWIDYWTDVKEHKERYENEDFQSILQKEAQTEIDSLKERHAFVAKQILLLRESVKALDCDGISKPKATLMSLNF